MVTDRSLDIQIHRGIIKLPDLVLSSCFLSVQIINTFEASPSFLCDDEIHVRKMGYVINGRVRDDVHTLILLTSCHILSEKYC